MCTQAILGPGRCVHEAILGQGRCLHEPIMGQGRCVHEAIMGQSRCEHKVMLGSGHCVLYMGPYRAQVVVYTGHVGSRSLCTVHKPVRDICRNII